MSVAIARAIDTVKEATGLAEGEVRTVGATVFVDEALDRKTRKDLIERLNASSAEVLDDGRTRINL